MSIKKDNKKSVILGSSHTGHDAAAAILENGIPVAHVEVERYTGSKYNLNNDIHQTEPIQYLDFYDLEKVEYVVHQNWHGHNEGGLRYLNKVRENPEMGAKGVNKRQKDSVRQTPNKDIRSFLKKEDLKFIYPGHHQCHASNAFFSSNFNEALIITADGGGGNCVLDDDGDYIGSDYTSILNRKLSDNYSQKEDSGTAFTVWYGKDNKIFPLRIFDRDELNIGSAWDQVAMRAF